MDVEKAIRFLNSLRRRRIIPEYALIGGVAAVFYLEPRYTKDIDIIVPVDDLLRDYSALWTRIVNQAGGKFKAQTIYLPDADGWLDVMPTGSDELHMEALRTARTVRVGRLSVRVVEPEYLIMMSLIAWRPDPDFSRIRGLLPLANRRRLRRLLRDHDDSAHTLQSRLETLERL